MSSALSETEAREILENLRWGRTPSCPYCLSRRIVRYSDGVTLYCTPCQRQFSYTVGTVFEGTHLSAKQLLQALYLFHETAGALTTGVLASAIQVTNKTARRINGIIGKVVADPDFWCDPKIKRKHTEPKLRRKNAKIIVTAYRGNNSIPFSNILRLYVKAGSTIADVTFGYGIFWRNVDMSKYHVLTSDIADGVDLRDIPYQDASVDALVLDPPFMTYTQGTAYANHTNLADLYKVNLPHHETERGHEALVRLYVDGAREALRVLKPKGVLIVKVMDEVVQTTQMLTHVILINKLSEMGFRVEDLFVVMRTQTPSLSSKTVQKHARKNHGYFLVFRKQVARIGNDSKTR